MTRKLQYSGRFIEGRDLYPTAGAALEIISPDYHSGVIRLYSTLVRGSMKMEEINNEGGLTRMYTLTLLTGTRKSVHLCPDKVKEHQLPPVFYIKICKK